MRLWPLALSLVVAASCNSGAKLAAAKFAGPSSLAAFHGYSLKHPAESKPRPYVAVANLLRDELTVLDPLDNEPVLSSTLAFPLSVPTHPRPWKLASARLEPEADPDPGADLLVVATQTPPSLQLVTTWTEQLRAVDLPAADDLATAYPGAAVLSLAAVTRPGGGAWVLVGLTGGNLAVLEFERDPTSTLPVARRPVVRTSLPLQRKDLITGAGRFDALDLAVAPDASRLFVATSDPLQDAGGATVLGVGQVAVVGGSAASVWSIVGLDARAPTRLVTAGVLAQRTLASSVVFESAPRLQVFAVLDEAGCGSRKAINCGVVAVLPDVGIPPDPSGELGYRAPLTLGAAPMALSLVMPRKGGDEGTPVGISWETPPAVVPDLMVLGASSAGLAPVRFWQTALLVVGLTDGRLVAVDPGRWGVVDAAQRLDADRRLLISSMTTTVTEAGTPRLGLWNGVTGAGDEVLVTGDMYKQVRASPGYLAGDAEAFTVAWQGALPGLRARPGIVEWDAGLPVAALQVGEVATAHLAEPELGIRPGDLVQAVPGTGTCADGFVARVVTVRAPSAAFPGGSLVLSHAGDGSAAGETPCAGGAAVVGAAAPGPVTAAVTIKAAELVLSGVALGYLGRPTLNADFELRYQPEAGLTGEALAVDRKLRRRFYPADAPCGAEIPGTETGTPPAALTSACESPLVTPPGPDPLEPGPILKFKIGCEGGLSCAQPGAGAVLRINSTSGLAVTAWRSPAAQGVPTSIVWLDAKAIDASRSSTVFASFTSNEVVSVVPRTGVVTSVR
ncbi:MAG: hypothetical protein HZB56_18675 [Deltaproteobacteria bacterium]|nr:hypothetical protein [Deltaproteobacteria bacterium]